MREHTASNTRSFTSVWLSLLTRSHRPHALHPRSALFHSVLPSRLLDVAFCTLSLPPPFFPLGHRTRHHRSCHEPCLSIVDPYVPLLASIFVYSVRNASPLSKPVSHMRTPETPMSLQLGQNKRSEEEVLRRCACVYAGV